MLRRAGETSGVVVGGQCIRWGRLTSMRLASTAPSPTDTNIQHTHSNTLETTTPTVQIAPVSLSSSTSPLSSTQATDMGVTSSLSTAGSDPLLQAASTWRSDIEVAKFSETLGQRQSTSTTTKIDTLEALSCRIISRCEVAAIFIKQGEIKDAQREFCSIERSVASHSRRLLRMKRRRRGKAAVAADENDDISSMHTIIIQEHSDRVLDPFKSAIEHLIHLNDIDSLERLRSGFASRRGPIFRALGRELVDELALEATNAIMEACKVAPINQARTPSSNHRQMDINNIVVNRLTPQGVASFADTVERLLTTTNNNTNPNPTTQLLLRALWEKHNPMVVYRSKKYEGGVFNIKDAPDAVLPPTITSLLYSELPTQRNNTASSEGSAIMRASRQRDCNRFETAIASFSQLSPSLMEAGRLPSHFHIHFTVPAIKSAFLMGNKRVLRRALDLAKQTSLSFPREDIDGIVALFAADLASKPTPRTYQEWEESMVDTQCLAWSVLGLNAGSPAAVLRRFIGLRTTNSHTARRVSARRAYLKMAALFHTIILRQEIQGIGLPSTTTTKGGRRQEEMMKDVQLDERLHATYRLMCRDRTMAAEVVNVASYSWMMATSSRGSFTPPFWAASPFLTNATMLAISECLRSGGSAPSSSLSSLPTTHTRPRKLNKDVAHNTIFSEGHPLRPVSRFKSLDRLVVNILMNNGLPMDTSVCLPHITPTIEADLMGAFLSVSGSGSGIGMLKKVVATRSGAASTWMMQWARILGPSGYTEEAVRDPVTKETIPYLRVPSPSAIRSLWSITVRALQPVKSSSTSQPPAGTSSFASLFLRQFVQHPYTPSRRDHTQRSSSIIALQESTERTLRQHALIGALSCCSRDYETRAVAGALSAEEGPASTRLLAMPADTPSDPTTMTTKLSHLSTTNNNAKATTVGGEQGDAVAPPHEVSPLGQRIQRLLQCEGLQ